MDLALRARGHGEDLEGVAAGVDSAGQRLAKPQKGINIIGGKKVVVK